MRPALTADEQAELEEGEEADVIALESGEAAQLEESAMPKISELMSGNAAKMQKLTELVREAVTKDSAGACNIVRAWISDDEI